MKASLYLLSILFAASTFANTQPVAGKWITDRQGQTLTDPQSSGFTWRHGELIHLGDNSAAEPMRNKLLRINPNTAQLNAEPLNITVSEQVLKGCFGELFSKYPDFESLTWDRTDDTVLISVTEDSSFITLSAECKARYGDTNSTDFPTLLVKIETDSQLSRAEITAVRPVKFPKAAKVGNFPNDGIEGLAIDNAGNLYLALEQNIANAPMIFKTPYGNDFWQQDGYVKVQDAQFNLPIPDNKDHPINGLDYLPAKKHNHPGYLIAAARNDDQLWIIDLAQQQPPFVQQMLYYAPTPADSTCPAYEPIAQTAIEGVAVYGDTVFLVNDAWKKRYPDNIQCTANAANFNKFATLLFSLPVDPRWFIVRP
ncbi:hypothetical protein [Rheinheimera maricola]|uniref:Esterase-like activity of phytase family protein n=1 Tax=Rheinheimera maricola TaxID=2793282 RepID=A0ABS7X507_9GAMM|nr:hypothetical protein [Rheinheimera maricola]MBZ9610629.1 hypothetical protein [Rheinheimera maricola]